MRALDTSTGARALALALALALATFAGGCGKGRYRPSAHVRPSPSGQRAAAAGPSSSARASRPITPARARAFARAVNLTAADIPGATAAPPPRHPEREDQATRRCGGTVSDAGAVQVESPSFTRGAGLTHESISSRVTVLTSARLARDSVAAVKRPSWLACYERLLRGRFAGDSASAVRVDGIDVSMVPVRLAGVGTTFGIRILAKLSSRRSRLSIRLYLDVFGFSLGRAEINMDATSYVQPEPTRTEQDLLQLMYERAGAHPL